MAANLPTYTKMLCVGLVSLGSASCIPIQLQAPKDPIKIDLNIKIDQEVRVRLEDDVNELITENPDLF